MATNDALPCGVYRHYTGFYALMLGLAGHTETGEKLVIYVPLEPHQGPRMRARPLSMFLESVIVDGVTMPRFAYIGPEIPD